MGYRILVCQQDVLRSKLKKKKPSKISIFSIIYYSLHPTFFSIYFLGFSCCRIHTEKTLEIFLDASFLDLKGTRQIISRRAWFLFSLSLILNYVRLNHVRVRALKSRNLCFLSIELETREFKLCPLTFTLLPGCLVSRDKRARLNASKSRDLCSKSTGSVIFFYGDREIKSRVRSRQKSRIGDFAPRQSRDIKLRKGSMI